VESAGINQVRSCIVGYPDIGRLEKRELWSAAVSIDRWPVIVQPLEPDRSVQISQHFVYLNSWLYVREHWDITNNLITMRAQSVLYELSRWKDQLSDQLEHRSTAVQRGRSSHQPDIL